MPRDSRSRRRGQGLLAAALAAAGAIHLSVRAGPAWVGGAVAPTLRPSRITAQAVSTFGATNVLPVNALEQLRGISAVVPDRFAFREFEGAAPKFTLASSRTIQEALESGLESSLAGLVERAMSSEQCAIEWGVMEEGESCFEESLLTLVGKDLLDRLRQGASARIAKVSTELPLNNLADPAAAVRSGQRILQMYKDLGVSKDRVLLRVPASYEGLRVVAALAKAGLQAHVTNVFSVQQAVLAKEAGAAMVQVYVGRVDEAGGDGIALARQINRLLKDGRFGRSPDMVAASMRSVSQVSELAGVDYMLVSPPVLQELTEMKGLDMEGGILEGSDSDDAEASGFLLSPAEFDAGMGKMAKELLEAGMKKNLKEREELMKVVADAKQYL